jgi:hypothetical protein
MAKGPLTSTDSLAAMDGLLGSYANLQTGWRSAGALRRVFGDVAAEAGAVNTVVKAILTTQPRPN